MKRTGLRIEAPPGRCACGCGQRTNLAPTTDPSKGWVRGRPLKYLFGHHAKPNPSRFWLKVRKTRRCWLWRGPWWGEKRYGMFYLHDGRGRYRVMSAHRASWILEHGPIRRGLCVLHRCDRPACVRPAHLFLGTHRDNVADMVAKRRHLHGALVNTARLTDRRVLALRRRHRAGASFAELGRVYGVSKQAARKVALGLTWRHVLTPPPLPL